jgi:hypothetical protein
VALVLGLYSLKKYVVFLDVLFLRGGWFMCANQRTIVYTEETSSTAPSLKKKVSEEELFVFLFVIFAKAMCTISLHKKAWLVKT